MAAEDHSPAKGCCGIENRIILDETTPVVTTRDETLAKHNFGPISFRDETLYTAERPGHYPSIQAVPPCIVKDWTEFMKSKNIRHVLIIMGDNEFNVYQDYDLVQFYKNAGLQVHHIPFESTKECYEQSMKLIGDIEKRGEKVVSHCTGGKGRCGRVACAWLCTRWSLTPLQASQEFIDQAVKNGLYRLGDVQKLTKWMEQSGC